MKFLFFFLFLIAPFKTSARLVERVQAQVAEEMISLLDLKSFQKRLKRGLVPSSFLLTELFKRSELLKDKNKLLDFMIYRNLLAQIAKTKPLPEVSEKQILESLQKLKGKSPDKSFSKQLSKLGINLSSIKQEILIDLKNDLLLQQALASKVLISEQDIESYHYHVYNQPLFKSFEYEFVSAFFPAQKKDLFFKKLSQIQIKDLQETALVLGLEHKVLKLHQRDLQKKFQKELEKLSVSQVSPLLLSGSSYYLLQLKWKYPQLQPKEQRKKVKIEQTLYRKQFKEEAKKWIEEKKNLFAIRRHPF